MTVVIRLPTAVTSAVRRIAARFSRRAAVMIDVVTIDVATIDVVDPPIAAPTCAAIEGRIGVPFIRRQIVGVVSAIGRLPDAMPDGGPRIAGAAASRAAA